jgi:hypothetical protein
MKFISPAAFLQSQGLLRYMSPLALFASSGGKDALKFLSPLGFGVSRFAEGGLVNGLPMPRASMGAIAGMAVAGVDAGSMPPSVQINTHIDATGADPAELSRVRAAVNQLNAELPYRVVQAWYDARSRNVIR